MSTVYKRKDSPFWWVGYIDAAGRQRCVSTKIRVASRAEYRQAIEFASKLKINERSSIDPGDGWENWVPMFITGRYSSQLSRDRVLLAWKTLCTSGSASGKSTIQPCSPGHSASSS